MRGFKVYLCGMVALLGLVMFPDIIQAATGGNEPPQLLVQPPHLWSQSFGDTAHQTVQSGSVAFDASGNVVMTGSFQGTVDFGGDTLTSAGSASSWLGA